MNTAVVLPVQNPDETIVDYIRGLVSDGIKKIIVVDDGSAEQCRLLFERIREIPECDFLEKKDKGDIAWALKDAFEYYLDKDYDQTYNGLIYAEWHGGYAASDIRAVSETMEKKDASLILSERRFAKDVDGNKKIGNRIMVMILDFLYGIRMKDPQTGLRGFPNRIISKLMQIDGVDYQYMINMVIEAKKHGIPVTCIKNEGVSKNAQVHTRPYPKKNSGFIYKNLIIHFIKYIISALVSFTLDVTLFQVFTGLLKPHHAQYILMATIIARAISSVWTFTFNRKVVFHSTDHLGKSLAKFYALVAIQMFASGVLVTLIFNAIRIIPEAVIKVVVDFSIFLISYKVEKQFIFK